MTWNDLDDIDETEPLGEDDLEALDEVRRILLERGLARRFGVALLHKHFPLRAGEVLVETVDVEDRTLTTEPKAEGEIEGDLLPTIFRFVEESERPMPTQYCYREPGWPDWLHAN